MLDLRKLACTRVAGRRDADLPGRGPAGSLVRFAVPLRRRVPTKVSSLVSAIAATTRDHVMAAGYGAPTRPTSRLVTCTSIRIGSSICAAEIEHSDGQ